MTGRQPTPEEARAALADAELQTQRARSLYQTFSGVMFIVWGLIYALAYGVTAVEPQLAGPVWLVLVIAGFVLSYWLGARMGAFVRSPAGRSLHILWSAFGAIYFLLGWALSVRGVSGQAFSLVVNLFVAYALIASWPPTGQTTLARAGAVLALVNTLLFVFFPGLYAPAMAALGLVAVWLGFRLVSSHEV